MTEVFRLADTYVDELCALDPFTATDLGLPGHDDEVTDFSPEGVDARADLARRTIRALDSAAVENDADRIAAAVMRDRLDAELEGYQAGAPWRQLSNFDSPLSFIRMAFDLGPGESPDDWERIATRMSKVPDSLDGFTTSLRYGLATGRIAPRRQALVCAEQAATLAGLGDGETPYFARIAAQSAHDDALGERLRKGARVATDAYAAMARFLRDEYAPQAPETDAVGRALYAIGIRRWLGMNRDPEEIYAWGWDELHRIEAEMAATAEQIAPGAGVDGAREVLQDDPARSIEGIDKLLAHLQELTDRTIADLDGSHFDIPEQIRRIECCEAPPGTAAAMYYTAPSADFSRPGRTWYPAKGRTRFPLWSEITVAYHEGVPGHHLQIGLCMTFQERLSTFQRQLGTYSGHGEGWALYAERLMHELGYVENPDYRFGMLASQAFRAMRVVVDIGLHLQLAIPENEAYHPGRVWDWDTALPFVTRYCGFAGPGFARSELERYCGMPAQAISYKVGERAWLDIRSQLRARLGSRFDLKRFHMDALNLGSMPLDLLEQELLGAA
ncbi:MAG: DUF885 domain-containing protein [Candidatus Dormiibacterota bacterium]